MGDSNGGSAGGIAFGVIDLVFAVMAAWCSWQLHHSVIWCGIHAICGPFYLLWLCLGCNGQTFPPGFW